MENKNVVIEKQEVSKTEIEDKEYLNLYFRNINSLILKTHFLHRCADRHIIVDDFKIV
ncbi:hypothetical protein [Solobacterium moorei]|uniref:hypothetical protein n=1 Tax=Solobacterium moorei TaxID=102148 RepID=UPI0012DDBFEC|nr:hypothetical protein [Solobacterium moorei]